MLPFPVSLGARRKKAVPSICAERRPGPARAPSRCHGHCQCPATRMWTPRARPAGAAAPGPVTVSESFRLRLRPRFLQVQVIEILFNRDRHWHSGDRLRLGLGPGVTVTGRLAVNLKFILGRRAALAFAVGQPWFVWGLPVFSNVQYGGCMGEKNTYGTIPPW